VFSAWRGILGINHKNGSNVIRLKNADQNERVLEIRHKTPVTEFAAIADRT
jgi:hypothetical protein